MRLISLALENFRNIESLRLDDFGDATVLAGDNAQGKTNILEAIFFVASGSSFRMSKEEFVIRQGAESAYIFADVLSDEGLSHTLRVVWQPGVGGFDKTVQIDGRAASRMDLMQAFPAVIFSPEDIDLLRLSPSHRRRFLDLLVGRHDAGYRSDLLEFTRIRRQRNQLLLLIKQHRVGTEELDVWDEKMAAAGARLVAKRAEAISAIQASVAEKYSLLAQNHNGNLLKVRYDPSLGVARERDYLERLQKNRPLDIARATTTLGIHRDDLTFVLNGQDVRYTASRGEFRSVVLALKLAEGKYLRDKLKEAPVFLLDDGFSELDEGRKQALADEMKAYQTLVTTNNEYLPRLFNNPREYKVEAGKVGIMSGT
ncbi:MAG: DNA replication/repair protein RecF [Patescibacteria group bacterium]|nr:DNA replication/repair protein RecF [Patescibacteria group bacterium]